MRHMGVCPLQMLNSLLLNLLFILIFVLLTNMLLFRSYQYTQSPLKYIYLIFSSCILIVICLLLSVKAGDGYLYDLRFIPFLLGGLYGGKKITIGLGSFLLFIRFLLGGDGFWLALLLIIIATICIFVIIPSYYKKPLWCKLTTISIFSAVYALISYLLPALLFGFHDFKAFAIYSIVSIASTFFVTYLIEILKTSYLLQIEALKSEKIEIVSHLAASISHEMRNPLTSVIGFLQLIKENEHTSCKNKTYAMYAIDEANRASEIINDYLTFAKPLSNEECIINIKYKINECLDILQPISLKQNIEVKTFFMHTSSINGDPHKFHQVLLNIFTNSLEAMPKGGILEIHTIEVNNKIHIEIKDTGHGMNPEHVARLGEPYFSLKGQKGTGLGMMVVFRIVESMNGTVSITSKIDKGTSITLSFRKKACI